MNVVGNNFNKKNISFKRNDSLHSSNYDGFDSIKHAGLAYKKDASIYIKDKTKQLGGQIGDVVALTNRKRENDIPRTKQEHFYGTLGIIGGGAVGASKVVSEAPEFKQKAKAALEKTASKSHFPNVNLAFGRAIEKFANSLPKKMQEGTRSVMHGGKDLIFRSAAAGAVFVFGANLFMILTSTANKGKIK